MKVGASTDKIDAELEPVPIPLGLDSLYRSFWSVNTGRTEGSNGYLPISYSEIKAYCELMDEPMTPWEIGTLKMMDATFLDQFNETRES